MTRLTLTALTVLSLVALMGTAYAESSGNTAELRLIDGEYFVIGQVDTDVRTTVAVDIYDQIRNNYITTLTLQTTSEGNFTTSLKSITDDKTYSSWVINVFKSNSGGMDMFANLHLNIDRSVFDRELIVGDGTSVVHVYKYPFDVTVVEGGSVIIHNESQRTYDLQHTGTAGTEKGGTFNLSIELSETSTLHFPITNCSSCYPAGTYYFEDGLTGETGSINIKHPEGWVPPVNEEVGITETVVVVLNSSVEEEIESSDVTVITNSTSVSTTEISDDIYNVPTFEGTYDILKLQQQLASITSDYTNALETIGNLKSDINDKTSKISEISRTNNDLKSQVVYLNTTIVDMNATLVKTENNLQNANEQIANQQQIDQTEVADLESKVSSLSDTITTLEQQKAEITKERDGWKQLADNWYAVAIEQLRVMTNVLGL